MDWIVTLVREIGVEDTRRLIVVLIILVGGYGVFLIIRRGNKDGDAIRHALEREQSETTRLRHKSELDTERIKYLETRIDEYEDRERELQQIPESINGMDREQLVDMIVNCRRELIHWQRCAIESESKL